MAKWLFINKTVFQTGGASAKELACQFRRLRRCRFHPCVGKILWRRTWQLTPVFLPGKFHGQRSLEGYSPWGHRESNTTEWLSLSSFSLFLFNGLMNKAAMMAQWTLYGLDNEHLLWMNGWIDEQTDLLIAWLLQCDSGRARPCSGLPWWLSGKESACQSRRCRRPGFDPWVSY